MSDIHLTVIAHGNGIAAFSRHIPLWIDNLKPVDGLVICPENDPIPEENSPWRVYEMAKAEHHGKESLIRLRWLLAHLAAIAKDNPKMHFAICEYDSFYLATPTLMAGWCGNCFQNIHFGRFMAPRYCNPPWLADAFSIQAMAETSAKWPQVIEEGEADRWLSAMAMLSCVPILPHSPPGYSTNYITAAEIPAMRAAIYEGAVAIHGIKQKWTLEAALQFFDERDIVKAAHAP